MAIQRGLKGNLIHFLVPLRSKGQPQGIARGTCLDHTAPPGMDNFLENLLMVLQGATNNLA